MVPFVALLIGVTVWIAPADGRADSVAIEGTKLLVKTPPVTTRSRMLFKSLSAAITDLTDDPGVVGAELRVYEASCSGGPPDEVCSVSTSYGPIDLAGEHWQARGNPAGSRGYRYRDNTGASGGARRIVYRDGKLVFKAVGDNLLWRPAGGADLAVVRFRVGDRTYCSEFGGTEKADSAGHLSFRNAPAPEECRDLCGDGIVSGAEECDPPDGVVCDAACRLTCSDEPSNTLVACTDPMFPGIGLAANADDAAVAFPDRRAADTHIYAKRLDPALQLADTTAIQLSADLAEADSISNGSPQVTTLANGFYAVWGGSFSSSLGFANYFHGRAIPSAGALIEAVDFLHTETPFGQCGSYTGGPLQVTSNLSGTGIHTTSRFVAYCSGSILYENIIGVPGDFASPPPGNVSTGSAPLASGDAAVAGVWFNLYAPDFVTPVELSLKAGWVDPAPIESVTLTLLDAVARSESPALAASGDVFLAVWTTATAPPPAVPTEIRGMRFTRADGALDPLAGFLIATAGGEALLPAVAGSAAGFVVAWREAAAVGTTVRAIRIDPGGGLIDPLPIDVAASDDAGVIAVGASSTGAYVAFTRLEDSGAVSVRVAALPQP